MSSRTQLSSYLSCQLALCGASCCSHHGQIVDSTEEFDEDDVSRISTRMLESQNPGIYSAYECLVSIHPEIYCKRREAQLSDPTDQVPIISH